LKRVRSTCPQRSQPVPFQSIPAYSETRLVGNTYWIHIEYILNIHLECTCWIFE
jgi:hypothetical protein